MTSNRAPLLTAIILLLLPVLYVGSYCALVKPWNTGFDPYRFPVDQNEVHYRWGGRWAGVAFWPLEQIDRKFRPDAWDPEQQGWSVFPHE
jgi:hypothetical protein